ncbi:MAG TPA: hypothetical protein VG929_05950 [Actinomycetota bacterium]|nr:hypothetical protein [Actinomycetota bacterium]
MEILLAGTIAGVLLAIVLFKVIWVVVGRAVDNLLNWAIYNFGNDEAVRRLEKDR